MNYTLKDLLDLPTLQALLDTLDEIYSLPSAIIDAEGNILTATAWQEICTKFHRADPETEKKCRESDSYLAKELDRNLPNVIYKCPHGLVDTATPIIVEGRHLGNVFTGQLFTEPPDEERFILQAREYGFKEKDYLEALKKVPVITEERLRKNLNFLGRLTEMLATQGLVHLRQLKTEAALRESEERCRRISDGLTDYQYTVRIESGRAVETTQSPACTTVTGYTAEEFAADPYLWIRMVAPEDRDMVRERVEEILEGKEILPIEHRILRKDGEVRWVRDTTILNRDDSGSLRSYEGVIKDITDHKKLEEQLMQAQKMEAVGLLAGGIAHDFNNMLSAIISAGSLLKMKTAQDSPQMHLLEQILSAADKSASLLQQLLAYRKQIISPRETDLNGLVTGLEKLLARVIGEDIELKIEASTDCLIAMVDPGQIEQGLMNLCTNARDSMPGGGALSVRAEAVMLDEEAVIRHGLGKPGRYCLLSVSDTGEGMDEMMRQRIFEPFFTTKEVGKGTGLGLSIVYGIIKQHEGDISVYSQPGEGTTFRIYLPLMQSDSEEDVTAGQDLPKGGTETILFADDSEEVRVTTGFMLREFGYRVIEAVDGEDAMQKFIDNRENIDLVILDVIMPKRNGKEVYEEIRKIRPDLKVLFMSGYTGDILYRKGITEDELNFISKPVMPHDMLAKIRDLIDHS